jgi:type IV secretory pathway TraG/TraD family ATPase VirD4
MMRPSGPRPRRGSGVGGPPASPVHQGRTAPRGPGGRVSVEDLGFVGLLAAATATGWVWTAAEISGWIDTGHRPSLALAWAFGALAGLPRHLDDPRLAWPARARPGLAGPALFFTCGSVLLLAVVAVAVLVRRGPDHAGQPGARWAGRADLRSIRVGRPGRKGRLVIGRSRSRLPRSALLATESRHSILVMGPTQSGKTTGLAIPAILDWRGTVVATSIKDDLASTTMSWRSRLGPCWIFDPTRSSGIETASRWSPLASAASWSEAQRTSGWLVEATPARSGMADAAFWYAAAAKQLAPLLLAAERGALGMSQVAGWTNAGEFDEPISLLELAGETEASSALSACAGRDDRIRSSVTTTLETVLAPFEDPVVAESTAASDWRIPDLIGGPSTLYLCGPSHEQHRVQGLFATLVSAVVSEAVKKANLSRRALDPPLLLVLDEAANIAPVRDLDTLASTGAGLGIQLVTVCQDLSQLAARYGQERSRTIANNHRAKVLLSGVADLATLDLVSGLAGEEAVRQDTETLDLSDGRRTHSSATVFRRLAPADGLRRLPPGEGLLVYGHLAPVRFLLRPWYRSRAMRRKVRPLEVPVG